MASATFSQLQPKERAVVLAFLEGNVGYIEVQYYLKEQAKFIAYPSKQFKPSANPELSQELLDSMNSKHILTRHARSVSESGSTGETLHVNVQYDLNPRFRDQLLRDLWSASKPRPVSYETLTAALKHAMHNLTGYATWFPDSRRGSGPTRRQLENQWAEAQAVVDQIEGTNYAAEFRERRRQQEKEKELERERRN